MPACLRHVGQVPTDSPGTNYMHAWFWFRFEQKCKPNAQVEKGPVSKQLRPRLAYACQKQSRVLHNTADTVHGLQVVGSIGMLVNFAPEHFRDILPVTGGKDAFAAWMFTFK
jgi:hypothetical protein